jgi:hypothetical protein
MSNIVLWPKLFGQLNRSMIAGGGVMCNQYFRQRTEEMSQLASNPVYWLSQEQKEELRRSGLEPDEWFRKKFRMSGGEWMNQLKRSIEAEFKREWEKLDPLPALASRKKAVELLVESSNGSRKKTQLKTLKKKEWRDDDYEKSAKRVRALREKARFPVDYVDRNGTARNAVITLMNRELQLEEVRSGHKSPFCPFREQCLDFATARLAKAFSCINCGIKFLAEIFEYD